MSNPLHRKLAHLNRDARKHLRIAKAEGKRIEGFLTCFELLPSQI